MKKQYCLEWTTKKGNTGWKHIGHDCPDLAEKMLGRKIKQTSTASAYITWNYVGDDIPDGELYEDHFYKGFYKYHLDVMGMTVYIDNDIREMERSKS